MSLFIYVCFLFLYLAVFGWDQKYPFNHLQQSVFRVLRIRDWLLSVLRHGTRIFLQS